MTHTLYENITHVYTCDLIIETLNVLVHNTDWTLTRHELSQTQAPLIGCMYAIYNTRYFIIMLSHYIKVWIHLSLYTAFVITTQQMKA